MIHRFQNKHHKILLTIILIISLLSFVIWPDLIKDTIIETDYSNILTIVLYLPSIFILIGLIEVFIPEKQIVKHLGKQSGLFGSLISFLLGALIPGPLYIAFPLGSMLFRKGISTFNVALFIGAWSCLKFGDEIFELQFLGIRFLFLRIMISIPFVIIISYITSRVHEKKFTLRHN